MPPNARPFLNDFKDAYSYKHPQINPNDDTAEEEAIITDFLDKQADTNGLSNVNEDAEDWTDVKHSERKKRDRLLDDGVLIKLMNKSDYQGFKRLILNLSIMAATAYSIARIEVFPWKLEGGVAALFQDPVKLAMFVVLFFFYGFQFQCFAFAGQHEFLHRNAFKTKRYNDI
jgi:hypothetical protein